MDINSLLNTQSLFTSNRGVENTLNLQVGHQLDVKTISADITAAKTAITLSLGNKDITVQSNQPVTLTPGQPLKIQVTQIAPVIEFKIISSLPELTPQTGNLRLRLISTAREGGSVEMGKEPIRPTAKEGESVEISRGPIQPNAKDGGSVDISKEAIRATANDHGTVEIDRKIPQPILTDNKSGTIGKELAVKSSLIPLINQALDAKIISINGNKIQLQIIANNFTTATPATETGSKQVGQITITRSQLTNAPSNLKVGQNLSLEITTAGAKPEFKIIVGNPAIPEAKIAEFIKQFLPRHEAAPIFLNQLIKDLPQLSENKTVPQTLKDIAAQIIQNLPPKEQLISSLGLKQALENSGLFLEAKLPAQAELIKTLPLLIKNESLPLSLQRIAGEILQNLTQKEPLLNNSAVQSKPDAIAELTALKLNLDAQTVANKAFALDANDFKANLLKFIGALKHELNTQSEQPSNSVDVDLFKNLQNKTENTIAKIVLDQLISLPREDNPKQLWVIDIPFLDRQQAESVRIEVQQDKESKQHTGSIDWSVNITITPPELGTIHCIVSYKNEVISTFFKSSNLQTTNLIKHNLDYLKIQLEEAGLKTGHMDAHDGPQSPQTTHQLTGKRLFDDKA
jgi:hypothetical protein